MSTTIAASVEKHHQLIIALLAFVVVFFATACLLNDVIPVCHYFFGCDHRMEHGAQLLSTIFVS